MANSVKLLEYAIICLKIASFVVIGRLLRRISRLLAFAFQFSAVFMFLLRKFVQIQFIPISMSFVLNESLATYNEVYSERCCHNFKRLGQEFNVHCDRAKHWKAGEIRELVNEAYALYAAFYLALNVYRHGFSREALNLYAKLRRLLLLLSRATARPKGLSLERLARIEIQRDREPRGPARAEEEEEAGEQARDGEEGVSLLTLLHAENAQYVSEQQLAQTLQEFAGPGVFEKVASQASALYNIASVLRREGMKEQARGVASHLVRRPKYAFGNLTFLRCLLLYQYKGVHLRIPVGGLNPGVIDALFLPDKNMLAELQLKRRERALSPAPIAPASHLHAALYGSDVYLRLLESYRGARRIVVVANPNGVCYEFMGMCPWDVSMQVDNGRSALLFNYAGVGESTGSPEMVDMTRKCNNLVDYLNEHFSSGAGRPGAERGQSGGAAKSDLVLSFCSTSLGGLFATKMCTRSGATNEHEFALFENTFGDLRRLSMHFVANFVGPLLRFVNLDVNCAHDFLKLDANKIVLVDVNDEIIPLSCSLAHSVARTQVLPGVARLANSFIEYKYKTLQLLSESLTSASHLSDVPPGARAAREADPGAVDDIVTRIKGVKEVLSLLGKNVNSTSQALLSFLEAEADAPTKRELASVNEFFTRLVMYGSMPNGAIPRSKGGEASLAGLYQILERLKLDTRYFALCRSANEAERLVRVPPRVAAYLSVLLDELPGERGQAEPGPRSSIESDGSSIYSNGTDRCQYRSRVLFRGGEYYVDFGGAGLARPAGSHLLEHVKSDLRNFGLSASRYRLLPLKLLAYFRLYALLNVFNTMALLDAAVAARFGRALEPDSPRAHSEGLEQLYALIRRFMFDFVQVLIGEPFGEQPGAPAPSPEDRRAAFDAHLDALRRDLRVYGLVIPHFGGHMAAKTPLDVKLLNSLIRPVSA